jgi:hypothetical protein
VGSSSWNPSPSSPTPSTAPEFPDIHPAKRDLSSRSDGSVGGLCCDRVRYATARRRWRAGVARCLWGSGIVGWWRTSDLRVVCVPTRSSGRRDVLGVRRSVGVLLLRVVECGCHSSPTGVIGLTKGIAWNTKEREHFQHR